MNKRKGRQTVIFNSEPSIIAGAAIAGKKEGKGPLFADFDVILSDEYLGMDSWEKAESAMQKRTAELALSKSRVSPERLDFIFSGDLQNQCTGTHYTMRNFNVPFFGLYGACSTMTESLILSAMTIDGGFAENILCGTSSHFCAAEKQFRFPLEYGGLRAPTAQWTVTGSGFSVIGTKKEGKPCITSATIGKIVDKGVTDINNMGAAMAPAAADTLFAHFKDTGKNPSEYDLILTGDLGVVGSDLLRDMMSDNGYNIYPVHNDCGMMIFDIKNQDVHAGGSGCGCMASVFCSHILKNFEKGMYKRIAVMATGALMNPQIILQGESIPAIAHLAVIEKM